MDNLAKRAGIDLDLFAPVGVRMWGTPPMIVSVYAISRNREDFQSFDLLVAFMKAKAEEVRLTELPLVERADLEDYFKQFEAVLTSKNLDLSKVVVEKS